MLQMELSIVYKADGSADGEVSKASSAVFMPVETPKRPATTEINSNVAVCVQVWYTVIRKTVPLYLEPELLCFPVDFYNSSASGNRNKCSIEK